MEALSLVRPQMVCERLEYGKFTDGQGTIDGGEHRTLALSDGFPENVKRLCAPRIIGPALVDNDARPAWATHGTVLQPVWTGNAVLPVFARVFELPERRTVRNYQRATFVAAGGVPPLALIDAVSQGQPEQFTMSPAPRQVPPIEVQGTSGVLDDASIAFANAALEHILAGTPVIVQTVIEERRFFELAESVWWRLPAAVRPWFSAGWGVGRSLHGKLAMSAGLAAGSGTSAVYDVANKTWSIPSGGGIESELAKGYVRVAHRGDASAQHPDVVRMSIIDGLMASFIDRLASPSSARSREVEVLRWDDASVRAVFHSLGRAASDAWRLDRLRDALSRQDWRDADPDAIRADLWHEQAHNAAVALAVAGLGHADTAGMAAWALGRWRRLERDVVDDTLRTIDEVSRARADELFALADRPHGEQLAALLSAKDDGVVRPVERAATIVALEDGLAQLDPSAVRQHDGLLALADPPVAYREFIARSSWDLAMALDRLDARASAPRLRRVIAHTPADARGPIEHLLGLASGVAPPEDARLGARLRSPHAAAELQERVLARWMHPTTLPEARDVLLEWALVAVQPGTLPLVDLVRAVRAGADPGAAGARIVDALIREVAEERVPPSVESLLARVAAGHLRACLGSILAAQSRWRRIAAHWSPGLRRMLGFGSDGSDEARAVPPEVWSLVDAEGVFNRLLDFWCDEGTSFLVSDGVARDLVTMIESPSTRFNPGHGRTGWTCQRLLEHGIGYFAHHRLENVIDGERAARLLRTFSCDSRVSRLLRGDSPEVWLRRRETSAHLLLLLSLLFHDVDLEFAEQHKVLLGTEREALRRHIRDEAVIASRREHLRVASARFHEFDYHEHARECPTTVLWAAFQGVPLERQRSLRDALEYYGGSAEERLELCERYVRGMDHLPDQSVVAERVIRGFIRPLAEAREHCGGAELLQAIDHGSPHRPEFLRVFDARRAVHGLIDAEWERGAKFVSMDPRLADFVRRIAGMRHSRARGLLS